MNTTQSITALMNAKQLVKGFRAAEKQGSVKCGMVSLPALRAQFPKLGRADIDIALRIADKAGLIKLSIADDHNAIDKAEAIVVTDWRGDKSYVWFVMLNA